MVCSGTDILETKLPIIQAVAKFTEVLFEWSVW
jgi:hypothetical protein